MPRTRSLAGLASTFVYLKRGRTAAAADSLLVTSWPGMGRRVAVAEDSQTHISASGAWLLLSGTLLLRSQSNRDWGRTGGRGLHQLSWQAILVSSVLQLVLAVYGGYFGAGIGFVILGMLAALGMRDILAMGAIRTLLAAACNVAAVATFIWAGAVLWPQCLVMLAGALTGGWFGARFAQTADPKKMRYAVIGIGLAMSGYFFVSGR
jgi:uncharacterized membrane protein YfcA